MWTVVKIDLKKINTFKNEILKKTNFTAKFFIPCYLIEKYNSKKIVRKKKNLFKDYIFCYDNKFKEDSFINSLKYAKGLKYFLKGNKKDQKNIIEIINNCKKFQNKHGYIDQKYFFNFLGNKLEIFEGPLRNMIFEILEKKKNSISFYFGKYEASLSNKNV